ncbi:MAG TPA: class A beta-lactamase [Steroidobacteraceae bacterium]|nr:class A beta-lactamase [Steroidobacteraceae bacterium]
MMLNRRALFSAVPALIARPALALEAPHALEAYERDTGGRVGLYAENPATGMKIAWRANERFVMCSTFKASLAAMILARVDHGQDQLQQMVSYGPEDVPDWYAPVAKKNLAKGVMSVADMCEAAVEYSDNTCANLLLARVGGPAALTAFWRSIGDAVTRLDHNEPILNRSPPGDPHDTTTPAAMAGNLRRILLGKVLSAGSRERLTGWMVDCKTGADRLRDGIPKAWRIADKTGNNGKDASGDIAVAWPKPDVPILVCAYTQGGLPTAARTASVFADIGRMVGQKLG